MEDYIFIIIAIILSVFGALNRKNKKRPGQMEGDSNETAYGPSFFEEQFVDPFFDEEEEPEPVFNQPVVPKSRPVVVSKPQPATMQEPKPKIKKDQVETFEKEVDPDKETTLGGVLKDFSLKKAVIYSEILERKY